MQGTFLGELPVTCSLLCEISSSPSRHAQGGVYVLSVSSVVTMSSESVHAPEQQIIAECVCAKFGFMTIIHPPSAFLKTPLAGLHEYWTMNEKPAPACIACADLSSQNPHKGHALFQGPEMTSQLEVPQGWLFGGYTVTNPAPGERSPLGWDIWPYSL